MNQRIKELAEQAVTRFDKDMDGSMESNVHGRWVPIDDLEKFAQLIVRKCLEEIRDEVQYEYDWKLADVVTERVLNYFGVEK